MNYKSILFFLGIYSFLVSCFAILNILYSIYFDYILGLNSYLITFIISALIIAAKQFEMVVLMPSQRQKTHWIYSFELRVQ